jgi:acetyl-CoA synthetase
MTDPAIYNVPANFSDAHITPERYQALYQQSMEDPDTFWSEQATLLDWHAPWSAISDTDISTGAARWFVGAQLNV